jgi:hypothetical protein
MEKLLKKGYHVIISHLNAIKVVDEATQEIHPEMQTNLAKHLQVFETPRGLNPSRGEHDHSIPLLPGSHPLILPDGLTKEPMFICITIALPREIYGRCITILSVAPAI